jgi:adenylosuccinate lyase
LLREDRLAADLDRQWAVVAEAIQTILRREKYPEPYEALKALTRGKGGIDEQSIAAFIAELDISEGVRAELNAITPHTFIGYAAE